MPRNKRSSDGRREERLLNGPYLLTRAQRIRRMLRDGWEPADLALARERHSRSARLRSRNRDEAGPADNPAVAVVVAVAEIDEEQIIEAHDEHPPQPDRAASFAGEVPLDSDGSEAASVNSQAEPVGAVPIQDQGSSSAAVDHGPDESAAPNVNAPVLPSDPAPAEVDEINARDEVGAAVNEMVAAAAIAAAELDTVSNSNETANHTEPTSDGPAVAELSIGDISVSSMINTTSVELDFGSISAPAPDVCSSINESSVDTSTMDSDAESI